MPSLSWNETRDRAIAFAREYKDAAHEEMQKHQFFAPYERLAAPLLPAAKKKTRSNTPPTTKN